MPAPPSWAQPAAARKASPYRYFVGIDPGINTGVATLDHEAGTGLQLLTLTFWDTVDLLTALAVHHGPHLLVVIEDPNLNRSLYSRFDDVSGNKRTKIAQNIGGNKAQATLLIEFCRRKNIAVEAVAPLGKLDKQEFAIITGVATGSQHARDAARLILGR